MTSFTIDDKTIFPPGSLKRKEGKKKGKGGRRPGSRHPDKLRSLININLYLSSGSSAAVKKKGRGGKEGVKTQRRQDRPSIPLVDRLVWMSVSVVYSAITGKKEERGEREKENRAVNSKMTNAISIRFRGIATARLPGLLSASTAERPRKKKKRRGEKKQSGSSSAPHRRGKKEEPIPAIQTSKFFKPRPPRVALYSVLHSAQ